VVVTRTTEPNELLKVKAKAVERIERPSTYGEEAVDVGTSEIEIEPTAEVTAADREAAKLVPDVDGWDSERLSALAAERLKVLSQPLADIDFSTLTADGFTSSGLVPSNVEVSTLAGEIQMIEGVAFEPQGKSLADELNQLRDRVGGETADGLTIHFKMVGVDLTDADSSTFATTVLVDVEAAATDGAVSQMLPGCAPGSAIPRTAPFCFRASKWNAIVNCMRPLLCSPMRPAVPSSMRHRSLSK
jgi:hypothetical protein